MLKQWIKKHANEEFNAKICCPMDLEYNQSFFFDRAVVNKGKQE